MKRTIKKIYIFFLLLIGGQDFVFSQIVPCVDSTIANKYYQCLQPEINPVCGCNGVTYRNECVAFRNHGVNTIAYSGVCQNEFLFLEAFPTVTKSSITLFFQVFSASNVTLDIRDVYGKQWHYRNFNFVQNHSQTLYIQHFPQGLYYILVYMDGVFKIKKFIKYN